MVAVDRSTHDGAWPRPGRRASRRGRAPLAVEALESRLLLSGPGGAAIMPWDPMFRLQDVADGPTESGAAARSIGKSEAAWTVGLFETKGEVAPGKGGGEAILRPPSSTDVIHRLPDLPTNEIVGAMGPEEPIELYRVAAHPQTRSVRVDVRIPESPETTAGETLWLLDGAGGVLGHWGLPAPGGGLHVVLNTSGGALVSPPDLVVGISLDGPVPSAASDAEQGAAAPPPVGAFVLSIGLDDATAPTPPGPGPARGAGEPSWAGGGAAWPLGSEPGGWVATSSSVAIPGLGQVDDVGALPTRSAGPAAGVMADGRAIPPIGPREGSVIDLTLIAIPAAGQGVVEPDGPDGLVILPSASGFPLLGSAGPSSPRDEDAAGSGLLLTSAAACGDGEHAAVSRAAAPPESAEHPPRRRPPVVIGIGVAVAVTFGFFLPDLVATFTPEHPRRLLPWSRRKPDRS